MLAEFMWLLGGCGEIKSAARLDLMYEHLTDEAAEDDDDTFSIAESVAASTRAPPGEDEEEAAARREQEEAEEAEVEKYFTDETDPEKPKKDKRRGYVIDLVATLFVEMEALASQTKAFGGTRLHRTLFTKMIYNVEEEWVPKASSMLERIVELVEWTAEPEEGQEEGVWSPTPIMDLQIYRLCRALHFLCCRCSEPVFREAIRSNAELDALFQLQLKFDGGAGSPGAEFLNKVRPRAKCARAGSWLTAAAALRCILWRRKMSPSPSRNPSRSPSPSRRQRSLDRVRNT